MSSARNLANLGSAETLTVDTANQRVGIGSTQPTKSLDLGSSGEFEVGTGLTVTQDGFKVGSESFLHSTGLAIRNVNATGVVTATTFSSSTGGISAESLSITGISTLIRLAVTDEVVTGIITANGFAGNVTGAAATFTTGTFNGNVTIGGTLTYEDVTNVDSLGIVTARAGVNVSGGQFLVGSGVTIGNAGVATFSGTGDVHLVDNVQLKLGTGSDGTIKHNGSNLEINESTGDLRLVSDADDVIIQAEDDVVIRDNDGSTIMAKFINGGSVELYEDGNKKFETTNDGTVTTGILTATDEVVTSKNLLTLKGTSWADEEKVYTAYTRGAVDLGRVGVEADGAGTAGQMIFEVASSSSPVEAMRINSSRKVGIGTDNPLSLLTVAAASASAEIELKRTNTNTTGAIGAINWTAMDGHSVANIWARGDGNNEGAHLVFKTTSAAAEQDPYGTGTIERLRITSTGDVGIGTNNPTRGPLHVHENSTSDCAIHLTNQETGVTSSDGFTIFTGGDAGPDAGFVNREDGGAIEIYTHNGSSVGERLRVGSVGQIGIAGANYGTSGQVLTSGGASAAVSWADAGGFWTNLHQGSYTFDSTTDSETITGLGNYDMLRIYMMVNATGNSLANPFPRITIGTASGMENDNYQSETRSGEQQGGAGGQAAYWPHTQPSNFGDPGGDYSAGLFTCEMFIANWQGTTYHTIGNFSGGYTSGTNQRLEDYSGSLAHRNKVNYDRIALQFASAGAQNTAYLKITIQGATYS